MLVKNFESLLCSREPTIQTIQWRVSVFKNLLTICLLISLCANDAAAQELKKISLGYPSLAFTQSHIWVAKEEGLFKKYGLDVDPIFLHGGQVATQALAAGEPPIVNVGTVIQANLSGYNLVLVAAIEVLFSRLCPPRYQPVGTVKGKKVGHQRIRIQHTLRGAYPS